MNRSVDELPVGSPLRKKLERRSKNGSVPRFVWAYDPYDPWHPWNELSIFEFVFWFFLIGLFGGLAFFIPVSFLF